MKYVITNSYMAIKGQTQEDQFADNIKLKNIRH